ncbi:MAG: hypothetical protein M1830_007804 [Pleopsidium flavum]|nr:MAG: hypothetical protein M1830_007804 [Pleopsidium flavum]
MQASSQPVALAAAKSSAGSDVFALAALLSISLLILLLLRHFLPLRTTPAYLLVPIFLALALPVSIILLVPIDLASSSSTSDESARGIWLPEAVMLVAWRIAYWLTFALTWVILPLLGEYMDSGYRTPKDRIIYSLRSNGRYQLIVMSCGMAGLIYIFIQNGFDDSSVKGLVMALAYCWGLILAIYLMGHGLVAIPRRLIRNAGVSGRLKRLQYQAPKVYDRLTDAIAELEELESQVVQLKQRKSEISPDHKEWIEDLAEMSDIPESRASTASNLNLRGSSIPAVVTDRYLAELTRKLNRARHKRVRFIDSWDRLVQEAADTQAILDSSASKRLDFGRPSPQALLIERWNVLTPFSRYLLHTHVTPAFRVISGIFFSLASVCVVWSELVKFIAPHLSFISLTVVHHKNSDQGEIGFFGQIIASMWILYMCTAALASFDEVKVWGNRALVRRNTYGESACWYAGQIAKLTIPLAYNFVTFLPKATYRKTTFYHFLGRLINLTPLGEGFDYFFPIFILVPVCATLFNLYGKAKSIFGFGILEDEDDEENPSGFGTGGWREGRNLIERELNRTTDLGLPLPSGTRSPIGLTGRPNQTPIVANSGRGTAATPYTSSQRTPRRKTQQASASSESAGEEDENFLQGFAHRLKNTLDTTSKPHWLEDLEDGFKRPKWMGGVDDNTGTSGRAESGRGMGRWFGGRSSDGRVHL